MLATTGTGRSHPAGQLLAELVAADGRTKVELWLHPGDAPRLELVQYHWGSGVGWYVQQRLALDAEQAAGLAAALAGVSLASSPRPRAEVDGNVIRLLFGE